MNKRSIEILTAITKYNDLLHIEDRRLVIIESRDTGLMSNTIGPFLSFKDLTAEDFFEIYRYKKSLEKGNAKKPII